MKTYIKFFTVIAIFVASCFMEGCTDGLNISSEFSGDTKFDTYLSLSVSNFDFAQDWDNLSEIDKQTFKSAKKRMDLTFDKNGIYRTKWTSSKQVNISDELFDFFTNTIVVFTGSNSGVINYYDPQNGCSGQCSDITI
jgi:hypothetical protein